MTDRQLSNEAATLDPADWADIKAQGHRMLDDMFGYLEHLRSGPIWKPMTDAVRQSFRQSLPRSPSDLASVHEEFLDNIVPYALGNPHPGFMGWVHGGGTAVGMLAEMLAAGLNANLGGRDHAPIEVERQITAWMRELFDFPIEANGLFVTGTSVANLIAVLTARAHALGPAVRERGVAQLGSRLRAYTSAAAHGCVAQAMDISGLGVDALRRVSIDPQHRLNIVALQNAVARDRAEHLTPFLVVATVGTVDAGAIDDLRSIAAFCAEQGLWFHVDGAYGALARLSSELAPRLAGIERADSIAFDFHKWGQVPYDAGFILVRDGARLLEAFSSSAAYLRRESRGMAASSPWPCDLGPDLSRGFRALKTWFTFKTYGSEALGDMIARTCSLARYLEARVRGDVRLELVMPAQLNIVCFRYRAAEDPDRFNTDLVAELQESGLAAPSTTLVDGRVVIRAAIVNHRTQEQDIDRLMDAIASLGARMSDEWVGSKSSWRPQRTPTVHT